MTKLGKLVAQYYRANVSRHNLYCYRSRKGADWTVTDQLALDVAKVRKKAVSKELRTYLKKSGMRIVWGDRNQIVNIISNQKYQQDKKNRKKMLERVAYSQAQITLHKLDLL